MDPRNNFRFTFSCSADGPEEGAEHIIETEDQDQDTPVISDDSSQSLTLSVLDYHHEFGRTYNSYREGSYVYPNDSIERERLSTMYYLMTELFDGRLYFAPLDDMDSLRYILDIGTGTGEWAIHMGDEFPNADITGTDLAPIQPNEVPPNVNFYVEDSSEPWEYSQKFDYIHTRATVGCFSSYPRQIVRQAFDNLRPGGWLESQEFDCKDYCDDNTLSPDSPLVHWVREMGAAAEKCDRPVVMVEGVLEAYKEVGFVDVRHRVFKMPLGGWPKDERLKALGILWQRQMLQGLSGFSYWLFNRAYGRSQFQTELDLVNVRKDLQESRAHVYQVIHVIYGRKPYPHEVEAQRRDS